LSSEEPIGFITPLSFKRLPVGSEEPFQEENLPGTHTFVARAVVRRKGVRD